MTVPSLPANQTPHIIQGFWLTKTGTGSLSLIKNEKQKVPHPAGAAARHLTLSDWLESQLTGGSEEVLSVEAERT